MAYMVVKGVKKKTKYIFPSEHLTRTTHFAGTRNFHCATLITTTKLVLNLILISFHVTRRQLFYRSQLNCDKHAGVFPGKMCSDRCKNQGWVRKNHKAIAVSTEFQEAISSRFRTHFRRCRLFALTGFDFSFVTVVAHNFFGLQCVSAL